MIKKAFQDFLKKTFDIREGEVRRAVLMQLNIFLIILTLLIVKPTVTGLFLSEIGVERLPVAFLLVAVFAVIISTIYSRVLGQMPLNRIILITLLSSVILFSVFGLFLTFNIIGPWLLYAFYVWVAIFGVLTASQFWILANVVFNVREAKRLFGFIGAGAITGGILGGYITTLTAEWIGSEQLPFVGAGFLFLCVPITVSIWKKNVVTTQTKFQRRKKIAKSENPLHLIRRSSHLSFLAAIIGVSVIVARLVDYQFNAIASEKIADPDELTAFLGFWFSSFNVISLVVQLLLTRRLVGVLGVGTSLFFLPGAILIGAGLLFFIPELWAAIFIKLSDGSLKQSINKAAVELLALPIPSAIKNQTKTFIDVVVDSIATGIGGAILIFLVNGLQLSNRFINLMIVILIGFWLFFVIKVRKTYLNSFRLNIQKAGNNDGDPLDLKNESVVSDLKQVLAAGTDSQILYVLRKLKAQPDNRFTDSFQELLGHASDEVVEEAIRNLYYIQNQHFLNEITPFINHQSQRVKVAAFDYIIGHSPQNIKRLMDYYLNDEDKTVRLAALISLAEESFDNPVLKDKFELPDLLEKQYKELSDISGEEELVMHKTGLLKALGLARLPESFPQIESFFNDEHEEVVKQAILSAGVTMHPHFLKTLIGFLGDSRRAPHAITSLIQYGESIVQVLSDYSHSSDSEPEILENIPKVVEHFGVQASADLLFYLLKNKNSRVRLAALRSLNPLKIKFPFLNFFEKEIIPHLFNEAHLYQDTLSILYVQRKAEEGLPEKQEARLHLIQLLEKRLDRNLERIFRLLGLKYPVEDVIGIFENIQNPQPDLRINALEYLDNLLDPGLKKVLIPIVETALLDSLSEEVIRSLKLKIPDEKECYRLLMEKSDEEISMAVKQIQSSL